VLGSEALTRRTLRFAWHLTTLAWFGFAALFVLLAEGTVSRAQLGVVAVTRFLLHAVVALVASRGRHFAWPVFLAISVLVLLATRG
jgi:hypothetical protein